MYILSKNLKIIAKWSSLDNIPTKATDIGVSKEQCQSLFDMLMNASEDITPFSYCDETKTTILLYKP